LFLIDKEKEMFYQPACSFCEHDATACNDAGMCFVTRKEMPVMEVHRDYQDGAREEFNFVVGFVRTPYGLRNGRTVMTPDKTIKLNHSKPITLARCARILVLDEARKLSGRDLAMISIRRSIYSKTPGNECGDFAETCYLDKRWDYYPDTNSLLIYDRGELVYANDNGQVCTNQAALYDSMGI
jgi:hypothetical protein